MSFTYTMSLKKGMHWVVLRMTNKNIPNCIVMFINVKIPVYVKTPSYSYSSSDIIKGVKDILYLPHTKKCTSMAPSSVPNCFSFLVYHTRYWYRYWYQQSGIIVFIGVLITGIPRAVIYFSCGWILYIKSQFGQCLLQKIMLVVMIHIPSKYTDKGKQQIMGMFIVC